MMPSKFLYLCTWYTTVPNGSVDIKGLISGLAPMIEFLKQLPHLEHYGAPIYFIYLILFCRSLWASFSRDFRSMRRTEVSLIFIIWCWQVPNLKQIYALLLHVWQILIVYYRFIVKKLTIRVVSYLHSFLSVLPLIFVKGKSQRSRTGTSPCLDFRDFRI